MSEAAFKAALISLGISAVEKEDREGIAEVVRL
jgi:hypothetical protein